MRNFSQRNFSQKGNIAKETGRSRDYDDWEEE